MRVAVEAAAELLNLSTARVCVALRYYGAHPGEIDHEIATAGLAGQGIECRGGVATEAVTITGGADLHTADARWPAQP